MRLVIKSEADSLNDTSLSGETILVGHEAECRLCLDRSRWPKVAGRHAEFRVVNGVCQLFDLDSGFGTYLDGRRIIHSAPVRIGSRIQFGPDGPQVTVAHLELIDTLPPQQVPARPARPPLVNLRHDVAKQGSLPSAKASQMPAVPAFLEVSDDHKANVKRLDLTKDVVRVGRSPELDLVFDIAASYISRVHAEIRRTPDGYSLTDLNSFNGTLLNRQRITGPSVLSDGDVIQLGIRGPILRFRHMAGVSPASSPSPAASGMPRELATAPTVAASPPAPRHASAPATPPEIIGREPLYTLPLDNKAKYLIGRAWDSDVKLDGLQVSKRHAILTVHGTRIFIEDCQSTNGVYVNGRRLSGERFLGPQDFIQIGPFLLRADVDRGVEVFDTRAQMRIDAVGLTKVVPDGFTRGTIKLLDDISLTICPNEFVGLLGPSGAGKSTFIDALNGMRPATAGQVLVNNLDLYHHLDWLKQSIGYVPQDDIIHRELTIYRTLYYVAKLRLAQDTSEGEVNSIINEVLDVTGLSDRRDILVAQLSGGQRKRVAVAVELLTKPSIIFLDEPTSGLDPATEEKIMHLFRQIAESGHTVVLTTHAMENVWLFDKIVLLMQGRLVFYGTPSEALSHLKATSFKEIYDKLEEPVAHQIASLPPLPADATAEQRREHKFHLTRIRESVAETWRRHFQQTTQYEQNVLQPQAGLHLVKQSPSTPRPRPNFKYAIAQWGIFCKRYGEVLKRDKFNLRILSLQPLIIAFLTWLAVGANSPRDFPYFILSLVPIWFGTSVAAREIIRERAVYKRERMVNLGILPYVGSKVAVLSLIVSLQCLILFGTLKCLTLLDFKLSALFWGIPQLLTMILTGMVGIALGLLVSASVKTSEMATSLVPLLLIPQLLFCGLAGVPKGATRVVGALMPATWSFDEMKRLSAKDVEVLRGKEEGAESAYNNEGRGLFRQVIAENERMLEEKELETKDYKTAQENKLGQSLRDEEDSKKKATGDTRQRRKTTNVELDPLPGKAMIKSIPDDLSNYVDFLHPWGSGWLNPIILLVMFLSFITATVGILRSQDVR